MRGLPLIPVEDEGRLHDPALRENFIERVFVFKRWKEFTGRGGTLGILVAFHSDHKLPILAHSPRHYTRLGRLVAEGKRHTPEALQAEYLATLMEGLKATATTRKNTNVPSHVLGYCRRHRAVPTGPGSAHRAHRPLQSLRGQVP